MSQAATATSSAKADPARAALHFLQPLDGATIFSTFDFAVALTEVDVAEAEVDGESAQVVVFALDKPIPAGDRLPSGQKFQSVAAMNGASGAFKLEGIGKQKLTIQIFDGKLRSWRPELFQTIEVEVIADQGARSVAWLEPKDGTKVKSPVKMKWDVKGMKVEVAGKDPKARTSGHHHVLIDDRWIAVGKVIPTDATHVDFGKGQTEAEIELPRGKHKLTLQFADGSHVSYGKEMSASITVDVE